MKTREVIHIACEVIILSVISFYFHKRLKKLTENVEELKKENEGFKLELDEMKNILSSLIMIPSETFSVRAPIPQIPQMSVNPSSFKQKDHVIFHPLSPIEEEEECDEDKCRLGLSELEEEGNILSSNVSQDDEKIKDTATIIFSTISPLPRKENTAKLEVIENALRRETGLAPASSPQGSDAQLNNPQIDSSSGVISNSIPSSSSSATETQSLSTTTETEQTKVSSALEPQMTKNEKLKIIDPKKVKLLRKKKNGNS
jgi:hypothetical protein